MSFESERVGFRQDGSLHISYTARLVHVPCRFTLVGLLDDDDVVLYLNKDIFSLTRYHSSTDCT